MKVAVFSCQPYEKTALTRLNASFQHELVYFDETLGEETISLAIGFPVVCTFVNDILTAPALKTLADNGTVLVALRCAGHDSVDLKAAEAHGVTVMRVPAYSPYAIAEFTIGILLALSRKIPAAWDRVQSGNFDLDGLVGHDLHGKTVGVLGTGRIGAVVARTLRVGFGCQVLAQDLYPRDDLQVLGVRYVDRETVFQEADILCLHCPLTSDTRFLINAETIKRLKPGVLIVNTSRGALIDTAALIEALESGYVGGCALDVYEKEQGLFFHKSTWESAKDPVIKRLISLPNVIVTGHQAFLSNEAIEAIAGTTLQNITNFSFGKFDINLAVEKYD